MTDNLSGFCVNDNSWWSSFGWDCSRTQSYFSNSNHSGFSDTKIKSRGAPTWKSDSSKIETAMVWGGSGIPVPDTVNPLSISTFYQSLKWGNTYTDKWSPGISRPDPEEKGYRYEGEKYRKSL